MMTTIPTSTCNQTMEVKRPREGGFCGTPFFGVLFYGGSFFFLHVFVKPIFFLITKNLFIIYKLKKIEGFYHKVNNFAMVLVFKFFLS